jgi:hypothetical protein
LIERRARVRGSSHRARDVGFVGLERSSRVSRARRIVAPPHDARDASRRTRATTTTRKYSHDISLAPAPHLCY